MQLDFRTFSEGGGTFRGCRERLDRWLEAEHPDVVFFNYGANDARAGAAGLAEFQEEMERCVLLAQKRGARVVLITPQAADLRKSGPKAAAQRTLYAETMLSFGRARGWTVVDIHHPLDLLQRGGRAADPQFSILRDPIHLTHAAYVAWGSFLYDRLDLPLVRSAATLTARGVVEAAENCVIRDVVTRPGLLEFNRRDSALPILPPGPLPPRVCVPLEAHSRYLVTVTGLEPGEYEIVVDSRTIGTVNSGQLADGVNINTLLLDGEREAPWAALANEIAAGKRLDEIGKTEWRFVVRRRT
jgi:lysophospholipase L1-like esterase